MTNNDTISSKIISNINKSEMHWKGNFSNAFKDFQNLSKNYSTNKQNQLEFLFIEILQNILKYSKNKKETYLWIGKKYNCIEIESFNEISEKNKTNIINEFHFIKNHTTQEIKEKIKFRVISDSKGIGLLELFKRSDNLNFNIFNENKKTYYHLKLKKHV